jgi:hypothetical protein
MPWRAAAYVAQPIGTAYLAQPTWHSLRGHRLGAQQAMVLRGRREKSTALLDHRGAGEPVDARNINDVVTLATVGKHQNLRLHVTSSRKV